MNEKFLSLCHDFGPDQVGMITGDAKVNPKAPIICCTAEILANMALSEADDLDFADVIMDEFHYYGDRDRGQAWQIPLITLRKVRFLLMSATMGDTSFFKKEIEARTQNNCAIVSSQERPVPLDFSYQATPLEETVENLMAKACAPIYIVSFTQRETAQTAQSLLSLNFTSKEEKKKISEACEQHHFSSPYGKDIKRFLKHGVGLHHAGLLPKYRVLVEQLAQKGLLKVISGTDTLGVGVNIPIRTVLLTKLCKYDGQKTSLLNARDFHQITGRAGRRGFDKQGTVICQAPAHVIENLKQERKLLLNPKAKKKFTRAKPPEKGYIHWDEKTFHKLREAEAEKLQSRFTLNHETLLRVLSRRGNGCHALKQLIKDCHESSASKEHLRKRAFQLFRSLRDKKIIEILSAEERKKTNRTLGLNLDLQDDFSLSENLSLYLLDSLKFLDPTDENYALNLLTQIESILENPKAILLRQLDQIKKERLAELKAEGVDYIDRLAALEELEYHKPNAEFIYSTFNKFADKHPWLGQENIRPKSIARKMYENFQSFPEYIKDYGLEKIEGLLLRYLSSVYKTLTQTVPYDLRTDEIDDLILFFETSLKTTDSSLIDEWRRIKDPSLKIQKKEAEITEDQTISLSKDKKALNRLIRSTIHQFLRALGQKNYKRALSFFELDQEKVWTKEHFEEKIQAFWQEYQELSVSSQATGKEQLLIEPALDESEWKIELSLMSAEGVSDWLLCWKLNLEKTDELSRPIMQIKSFGPLSTTESDTR